MYTYTIMTTLFCLLTLMFIQFYRRKAQKKAMKQWLEHHIERAKKMETRAKNMMSN
jgi:preprotein translocase subunit SecG